ncbi:MAG: NAD-dependent epimerase/dehydratase family protein [Patescibacteria group bacterium]|nr:NAD-dependent epimerase/dehydratase family protein [Patescibacteria group bacterium]MDD5490255.1 NAD-dependent epimerase/dehydratase family protein [Patescibacteria group bacterium]
MSRVLVTGGAGFVGSHLVDALIKKDFKVVAVDDLSTGKKSNLNPRAKFYKLDISGPKLENVFKKEKPDYVFHYAAQMDVRKSVADPLFDARVNILGGLNVIANAQKYKIKKIIFASSGGAVYGESSLLPTPESAPTNPVCPYGVSKLAAEKYLCYFWKQFGIPYVALRFANIYGPRQRSDGEAGVVAIFISKILQGEQPIINGDGRQTRDYVYIDDVVKASLVALKKSAAGSYNIGTGRETDVNKIFKLIAKNFAYPVKVIRGPAKPGEQRRSVLDARKIKKELGWSPRISIEEGIKKTAEWIKKFKIKNGKLQ